VAKVFIGIRAFKQPMPVSGKVLEDSIRLGKIRRIKYTLYMVQTVILVALSFVVIFVTGDATITPKLYLPMASFIAVIALLLLITCLESFFFRILEIRFARSSSARHLMAKNSMKRAIVITAITGVLAFVLVVPSIIGSVERTSRTTTVVTASMDPPSFYSSDPLALVESRDVRVTGDTGLQVYLLTDENYRESNGVMSMMFAYRINKAEYVLGPNDLLIDVPTGKYLKFRLVLNDMDNRDKSATMVIEKSIASTFTGLISLLMIAFVVSNVAWVVYLIPIERKYSAGSIYK